MTAAELNAAVDTAAVAATAAAQAAEQAAAAVAPAAPAAPAKRTRRPAATVKTGDPAADRAAKAAATAKANAKNTPAKPAAKATTAKATTVKYTPAQLAKLAPAGYVVKWPHGQHSLLAKTDKAGADASPWLVLCNAHGTTTPAKNAKEGEALGTAAARVAWCKQCKTAK